MPVIMLDNTGMSLSHTPTDTFNTILHCKTSAILQKFSLQIMHIHIQTLSEKHILLQHNLKNVDSTLRLFYHPSVILLLKVFTLSLTHCLLSTAIAVLALTMVPHKEFQSLLFSFKFLLLSDINFLH